MSARTRLAGVYYDLAVMLDAGVPIMRSLDIAIQGRQGLLRRVLSQMRESLSKGSSVAESMDKHRGVFPALDRVLVEAAETSGSLGESFKMLSEWHEFVHRIIWKMLTHMMYPFLILHVAAFVFPLPSLILGKITGVEYIFSVLRVVIALYVLVAIISVRLFRPERVRLLRYPMDVLVLWVPVLGQAVYHMAISRYAKAFGMLYKAGVPIAESTERACLTVGNQVVAGLFAGGTASIRSGGMAWEGFSSRLPREYRDLWQIGEEAGELDKTVDKIAEISTDRADLFFNEFARWLPIVVYFAIMAVVAAMVLTLASQVYGNLYSF